MSKSAVDLDVREGTLAHGLPYLALGTGTPLVFLRWLTADHANPTGLTRTFEIRSLGRLARHFRVYAVNRAPGMAEGTTMADIAAQHAEAIKAEFGGPVNVAGMSSGGSLALQLAADHPEVVRRLVVLSSGYRLDPEAKAAQLLYAETLAAGRRGLHLTALVSFRSAFVARAAVPVMWLMDPFTRPKDPSDLLAFVRAEDDFDMDGRLGEITAPTLVVGGENDAAYSVDNFRRTAAGIPGARLIVYPRTGHVGALSHRSFARDVTAFLNGG